LTRDQKLWFNVPFDTMHAAMHPNARGTIVNIPPIADPRGAMANTVPSVPAPQVNEDLLGIFDSMAVSQPTVASSNPFDSVTKPDPPEVANQQSYVTQPVSGTAPSTAGLIGTAQAPIQVDTPFQPTIVPVPAVQPSVVANNAAVFAHAPSTPQQVPPSVGPGYNPAGYGYAQPSAQPSIPVGQTAPYTGYNSHYNQVQVQVPPPQYQAGYTSGAPQPSQQTPPKSTNPFDPFA
jgi:hypothetical protein